MGFPAPLRFGKGITRANVTPDGTDQVVAIPLTQAGVLPKHVLITTNGQTFNGVSVMPTNDPAFTFSSVYDGIYIAGLQTHLNVLDVSGFSYLAFLNDAGAPTTQEFHITPLENF